MALVCAEGGEVEIVGANIGRVHVSPVQAIDRHENNVCTNFFCDALSLRYKNWIGELDIGIGIDCSSELFVGLSDHILD